LIQSVKTGPARVVVHFRRAGPFHIHIFMAKNNSSPNSAGGPPPPAHVPNKAQKLALFTKAFETGIEELTALDGQDAYVQAAIANLKAAKAQLAERLSWLKGK